MYQLSVSIHISIQKRATITPRIIREWNIKQNTNETLHQLSVILELYQWIDDLEIKPERADHISNILNK